MGLLDKAKDAAEQARQAATQAVDQTRGSTERSSTEAIADAPAPHPDAAEGAPARATGMDDILEQMKKAAKRGKTSLATIVEKIDPGVLADLIIKATAAQEKANIALRDKQSPYRIAEINITATIPPQVGFSVQRMGDMDELDDPSSLELLEEEAVEAEEPIVSLMGDNPIEEIGND